MYATTIPAKKYLVDGLNEAMPQLYKAYAHEGKGRQVARFLQHSIMRHADEETLAKILLDVRQEVAAAEGVLAVHL